VFVGVSVPSGAVAAGFINELRTRYTAGSPVDRSKAVVLRASGYGATIRVDVTVL
jgi:hypothetical protein